ncbi:DUF2550 domain-containing protein [Corynebacterium mayonis]|uniref:DUF2550 domain-containing protein n=1 Tax=Corynebacterium mayonis TaxID=3062461 RepID=UPI003140B8B4
MEVVVYAVVLLVVFASFVAAWRFMRFRNAGAQGMFRRLPARGVHGWRHGILHYKGEVLQFYKLRSLSLTNDLSLERRSITIDGVRQLSADEREFMPQVAEILQLSSPFGALEFAAPLHAQMALVSWIEAAPDQRQQRRDLNFLAHQRHNGNRKGA